MNRRFRIVVTDVANDPFRRIERRVAEGECALSLVHPVDRSVGEIRWDRIHAPQPPGRPMPDVLAYLDNLSAAFLAGIEA